MTWPDGGGGAGTSSGAGGTPATSASPGTVRLTISLRARDHAGHHSLATEIIKRARKARLAGATVLEARQGQGRSRVVRSRRAFIDDSPLAIVIVEDASKLEAFRQANASLLDGLVLAVEPVDAFRA